jgi:hypothetical protein
LDFQSDFFQWELLFSCLIFKAGNRAGNDGLLGRLKIIVGVTDIDATSAVPAV